MLDLAARILHAPRLFLAELDRVKADDEPDTFDLIEPNETPHPPVPLWCWAAFIWFHVIVAAIALTPPSP